MAHRRVHFRGGVGGARGRSGRIAGPSEGAPRRMALYFSGRERAGENLAKVLKQRAAELSPAIQMSDALSRNVPKVGAGVELLLANCMAHYLDYEIIQSECGFRRAGRCWIGLI